jgi:hypothetical protein
MAMGPIDPHPVDSGQAEFYLHRVPPPGWIGGECKSGFDLASTDLVAAVVDHVRAYPTGLEFWVTFHPAIEFPEPLRALKTPPWMRESLLTRSSSMIAGVGGEHPGDALQSIGALAPSPIVDVVTSDGHMTRSEPFMSVEMTPAAAAARASGPEEPRLFETERLSLPTLTFAICFWLRPVSATGSRLTVRLRWPEAGLEEGSASIDLEEVRIMASRARRLVEVRFPHMPIHPSNP